MPKQIINTEAAPAPIGPYNQSVKANGFLFISGQIAIDPETGALAPVSLPETGALVSASLPETGALAPASIGAETHQVMKNLQAILVAAGTDFSAVVKTTIFLSDMSLFATVNEVYGGYFSGDYPARETVAVKGLPKGVNVEISMIAAAL